MADHCDCCGGNRRRAPAAQAVSRLWRTASCPSPFASNPPVLDPARQPTRAAVEFDANIKKMVEDARKSMEAGSGQVVHPPQPLVVGAPSSPPPEKKSQAKVIKKEEEEDGNPKKRKQQEPEAREEDEGEEGDQDVDGEGVMYTVSFRCKCGAAHDFSFRKA